ncbi:uncharacterized protein LOC129770943 [Toxorhynchites rutilus septentrionalis]|uniref:uncharacterized protein LOC129770943 n=1 Tax=Toxorhynchites rutilus septentrionalis TaxID=329112 RepID=UPI00247A0226|nr:uncharacterized protein LOC129770943 [Toxorhynchites rutilus septentrionalis]
MISKSGIPKFYPLHLLFRLLLLFIIRPIVLETKHDVKIHLQNLGRQPILIFHQGEGRLRLDYKYYIHHFNLTIIRTQIKGLRDQFDNFSKNQFTDLIVEKFNEIDFALKSIDPIRRHKRWDSLGAIWKFLAGSPDANDLKIINSSRNNLIINNNEQVKINREVNLQLKEAIFQTKKAIQLFNVRSIEMYCTKLLFHLNFLSEKLNQIINTIMLAKLGLVNEQILSQREIDILITDLARENITVHTAVEATNYATTSVASNNLEIALIIKMPKLDPRIFNKIRLYPIIHNNKKVHTLHQLYLSHDDEIYRIGSIEPTIFATHEIQLDNTTCIPKLLKGEPATCNYTSNPIEEEVLYLDERHILINTMKNFTLSSNCGITQRNLSGSFVIFFSNCQLYVNNVLYTSRVQTLPEYINETGSSTTTIGQHPTHVQDFVNQRRDSDGTESLKGGRVSNDPDHLHSYTSGMTYHMLKTSTTRTTNMHRVTNHHRASDATHHMLMLALLIFGQHVFTNMCCFSFSDRSRTIGHFV